MLRTVGINLDDCFRTNVFSRQPSGNNLGLYGTENPSPEARSLGALTHKPQLWIADEWLPEVARLRHELAACQPNIILALGNVACWALLGQQGINSLRGSVHVSDFLPGRQLKVLPTFHPAAVLRQWDQRVISIADFAKASAEAHTPEFTYDNTELWLAPTLRDLETFGRLHLENATEVATDVETKRGQITYVSFAPRPDISIAIPFWIDGDNPHYWGTEAEELQAWRWVKHWIEKRGLVKVLQNGLYDIQYFLRHGLTPVDFREDTMLAHHSLFCEMRKGLGFRGSIYCTTPSWKSMRTYKMEEQLKKND
jgi:hypothetical protein